MKPFNLSRPTPATLLPALALLSLSAVLAAGCDDKQDAATQGAYGEPVANAPSPAAAPPIAAKAPTESNAPAPGATVPSEAVPPAVGAPNVAPNAPMAGAGAGSAPAMNAPFAGGMAGDPNAPLTPTPDLDSIIAGLEKGKDKKALAAAYATRGDERMHDDKAGAKVKYRKALEDFRVALKNDPTNEKASTNKEQIESIYRSMGRPIPGEESAPGPKAK